LEPVFCPERPLLDHGGTLADAAATSNDADVAIVWRFTDYGTVSPQAAVVPD